MERSRHWKKHRGRWDRRDEVSGEQVSVYLGPLCLFSPGSVNNEHTIVTFLLWGIVSKIFHYTFSILFLHDQLTVKSDFAIPFYELVHWGSDMFRSPWSHLTNEEKEGSRALVVWTEEGSCSHSSGDPPKMSSLLRDLRKQPRKQRHMVRGPWQEMWSRRPKARG